MENQTTQYPCGTDIIQKYDSKSIILSILLILTGIAVFSLTFIMDKENESIVPLLLMACGCALTLYGIIRILGKSTRTVYAPTGSSLKEHQLYFAPEHLKALQSGLAVNHIPTEIKQAAFENTTVRMDVLLSEDKQFARLQLMHYENYIFHPVTEVLYYNSPQSEQIHDWIKKR